MDIRLLDFEMITRALYTSYESLRTDENLKGMDGLKEAEKNLFDALSFHLQRDKGLDD
ncbi:hypothetical protein [Peribacillus sp. SCS-155]|uniref:hypothetical protein n=1 Tax=Peribacillus sedimenti TaxID=3115297 RepID=UPI00390682A0